MGVTVLPYIDQAQTARLQEAASANIQTPKNTDEAVTTFKECLASAERSVQAMAVDALLAASNSGAVSLDTVQQILGFTPQTDAPVDTSPVTDTPEISSSSAANSTTSSGSVSSPENLEEYFKEASEHTVWISTCSKPLPSRNPISIHPQPALPVPWASCS